MSQFILLKELHFVEAINAILHFNFKNKNRYRIEAKHNVCRGSPVTGQTCRLPRRSRRL